MTTDTECCTDQSVETRREGTSLDRARARIVTPRGLTVAGIAVIAIGLAFNWRWLVAVGAAPIILSLAPCAAMCALGLCMNMRGHSKPAVDKPSAGGLAGASELTLKRADGEQS